MKVATSTADTQRTIMAFVREFGHVSPDDSGFTTGSDLFDSGYLDSLAIVSLTAFLEETYGITLSEQQLFDSRMSTVAGIAEIIAAKPAVASNHATDHDDTTGAPVTRSRKGQ